MLKPKLIPVLCSLAVVLIWVLSYSDSLGQTGRDAVITIKKTTDFSIDGRGSAKNWEKTDWIDIPQRATSERQPNNIAPRIASPKASSEYRTKSKVLYSETGIYFLFQNEDQVLQATMDADFMHLWWEDVIEVFLWPDENYRTYFEYQISPLNYELILRITNDERSRSSWQPFSYGGNRRTRHMTSVEGGDKESGASISQWSAEFFLPYRLLHPASNIPPESGTRWRANLYRLDYDTGDRAQWQWQPVERSNHEIDSYGTFLFE